MDLEIIYDKIYRYVYFRIKDQTAAEDITQETFLRYISKKGSGPGFEMRYLYTIAKNLCIDEYRKVQHEPMPEDYESEALQSPGIPEEKIMIREALSKLSEEDREILLLRHVNGESAGTISYALGISRFALYRRLKSAEDRLRENLEVGE